MTIDPRRVAVLALHWQVNVIEPEGFFGGMLAEPVRRTRVVARAARFHATVRGAGLPVYFSGGSVANRTGSKPCGSWSPALLLSGSGGSRPSPNGVPGAARLHRRAAAGPRTVGAAVLPRSGFWTLLPAGVAALRAARRDAAR